MDLESLNLDVLWLKMSPHYHYILFFCYCSPDLTDYPAFFQHLTSCHEALLTSHLHAEVLYFRGFNVHHIELLNSNTTDVGGREEFDFSISNELEQIIKHPTCFPDRHGDRPNILVLFFTFNPSFLLSDLWTMSLSMSLALLNAHHHYLPPNIVLVL